MENLTEINKALNCNTPSQSTSIVCRKILKERMDELKFTDKNLKTLTYSLINQVDVIVEVMEKQVSGTSGMGNSILGSTVVYGLLGCFGLLSIASDNCLIRFLGTAMAITSGFGIGRNHVARTAITKKKEYVVTTTVNQILSKIEVLYKTLSPLASYNQLCGKYIDVLRWLQSQYSSSSDHRYKEDIKNLVNYLGFSFIEYEKGLEDYFAFSEASNVTRVVTSVCAVKNDETGVYVLDGIVVTPKK